MLYKLLPLLLLSSLSYASDGEWFCKSKAKPRVWRFGTVKVSIVRAMEAPPSRGDFCRVEVSSTKKIVLKEEESSIAAPQVVRDTNGDGYQELVIEGYSGGAHCCWTYWLISLSPKPTVVLSLENFRTIEFGQHLGGKTVITAQDGVFDYFRASHAGTYFPRVFLQLRGNALQDVSSEFPGEYDREIREGLKALTPNLRKKLLAARSDRDYLDDLEKYPALQVILSYLYSGREVKAWQAMNEVWPAYDREKLKSEILENRRRGILRYTR